MKSKKILFIHHGYMMGGAPVSLRNTILGLQSNSDFQLKVLCARKQMKPFFQEIPGIKVGDIFSPFQIIGRLLIGYVNPFNIRSFISSIEELILLPFTIYKQLFILKRESPDIVHLNSSILISSAIAVKIAKIPLVWHVREVLTGSKYNLRKQFAGWLIRKLADKVIAISPAVAKSLGMDNTKKVQVIYNFVDLSRFNASNVNIKETKDKFDLQPSERAVISLGGISFRKGTVQIIEACKYLDQNTKVLIAGPAPRIVEYNKFKKQSVKLFLRLETLLVHLNIKRYYSWFYNARVCFLLKKISDEKIRFIGVFDNVVPLLAISELLVFAGTTPHFPRPIYEAWAMGKPVVVFDMEGISDNVENKKDGIIIKKQYGKDLGNGINLLLENEQLRNKLGKNGKRKALERFDMNKNIQEIITIYENIFTYVFKKRGNKL